MTEFFSKLCKKCGSTQRYASSTKCVACAKRWNDRLDSKCRKRGSHVLRTFGVGPTEYNFTLAGQNFCCGKCGKDKPCGQGWATDHCHETGRFRGILCFSCNTSIGKLGDNVEGLLEAVEYILGEALPTNLTKQILQMDGRQKASPPIEPNARPRPSLRLVSSSPNFVGQSRRSA